MCKSRCKKYLAFLLLLNFSDKLSWILLEMEIILLEYFTL